jgi:hypothetical protein
LVSRKKKLSTRKIGSDTRSIPQVVARGPAATRRVGARGDA